MNPNQVPESKALVHLIYNSGASALARQRSSIAKEICQEILIVT